MSQWNLSKLLGDLHADIEQRLRTSRSFGHPGAKGDASEGVWVEMLAKYLPERYAVENAFVVDSEGTFSDQIDVVIFDRQYSPFILRWQGQTIVPAESVYAAFEAKQAINSGHISYAQNKVASVRRLKQTSLPIPHAGGTYPPKPPISILGGILAFESDWSPPLGDALRTSLMSDQGDGKLDLGCVATDGHFFINDQQAYEFVTDTKPATAFLFKLISELQLRGTVPMIDIEAYARWLNLETSTK